MDQNPTFAHGQDIRDRTFAFACRVIKFCDQTYTGAGVARLMAPQLLSCGTSIAIITDILRNVRANTALEPARHRKRTIVKVVRNS